MALAAAWPVLRWAFKQHIEHFLWLGARGNAVQNASPLPALTTLCSCTPDDDVTMELTARHIQDHSADNEYIHYWGYASRVVPCKNDAGSCAYLDAVYWMHDVSMLYTFIMWGVLLGIATVWLIIRGWRMGSPSLSMGTWFDKLANRVNHWKRRWLIQDSPMKWIFGRVSVLQITILAVISVYLTVFSYVPSTNMAYRVSLQTAQTCGHCL